LDGTDTLLTVPLISAQGVAVAVAVAVGVTVGVAVAVGVAVIVAVAEASGVCVRKGVGVVLKRKMVELKAHPLIRMTLKIPVQTVKILF
jgi:hypothetical protein